MRHGKALINKATIQSATGNAKRISDSYQKKVDAFRDDSNKDERIKLSFCKTCFYFLKVRVGGSAMTRRECGICSTDSMFSSTATNPICEPCGKENGLCVRCSGDVDMVFRRKPYPFEENEEK